MIVIEVVDDFKYLGSMMSCSEKDFKNRIGQAWGAFWKLEKIWKSKTTSTKMKINIFQASCISILLYGSEAWILTAQLKDKLNSFGTNCYRIMLHKIPNKTIYEIVEQEPLSVKVARRQLTWVGHMMRRNDESPIKTYGLYEPSIQMGKKIRGKPKLSYRKYIAQLLNPDIDLSAIEIREGRRIAQSGKSLSDRTYKWFIWLAKCLPYTFGG